MADATYPSRPYHKQDGSFVVPSGASLDVESGGTLEIAGTAITSTAAELNKLDGTTANLTGVDPVVYCHTESVSIAEVNSGHELIAAVAGRTITVVDWSVTAVGGAAGAATSVDLQDDAGTPVSVAAIAVAALTENTVVKPNSANVTDGAAAAGIGVGLTASKGLDIIKNGSDVTTATSFTVTIQYTIADA